MLDQRLIESLENNKVFDSNDWFRFYFDREDLAVN